MDMIPIAPSETHEEPPENVRGDEGSVDVDPVLVVENDRPIPTPTLRIIPPPPNLPVDPGVPSSEAATAMSDPGTALEPEPEANGRPKQKLPLKLGSVSLPPTSLPPPHNLSLISSTLSPTSPTPSNDTISTAPPSSAPEHSPSSRLSTPSSALTPQSAALVDRIGLRWKPRQGSMASDVSIQTMATLGSAGSRGKLSRDKQGWGNMPVGVMHNILSHAMDDLTVPHVIDQRFFTQANDLALFLLRRVFLCRMRRVSTGCRNAVDSHPFWPEYTLEMDQSRRHPSTIDDLEASSLTPSTPSFPTLFHRARHTTLHVCLACRLNHPDRVGLYPAVRKRLTHTASFGSSPTCERHHGNYCSSCMREQEMTSQTRTRNGVSYNVAVISGEYINLQPTDPFDTDQLGISRGGGLLCAYCRRWNIDQIAKLIVRQAARGTMVRGAGWWHKWEFDAAKYYVNISGGTLWDAARNTVDEYWLFAQTRWRELYRTAWDLQVGEETLRLKFLVRGTKESQRERAQRMSRLAELEGLDADEEYETPDRLLDDTMEMNQKYLDWQDEALGTRFTERDLKEWRRPEHLNQKWWRRLYFASISDWIRDRVRYGLWIAPSDELQNYVDGKPGWDPEDDTDLRRIAMAAVHPFAPFEGPLDENYDPQDAYCESFGIMYISNSTDMHDPNHARARGSFFPPRQLLDHLDFHYADRLREVLRPALVQCAKLAWYRAQDEQAAEEICSTWSVEALLALLRRPGGWSKDGLIVEELQRRIRENQQEASSLRALEQKRRAEASGRADTDEDHDMGTGDELENGITPDYMMVNVDEDSLMSDTDDLVSVDMEERASIRPIQAAEEARRASPRIELVVEEEEEVENPANIQEVVPSPSTTLESISPRATESAEPVATPAPVPARSESGHAHMNSIDDVLKMQAELLARSAQKRSEANGDAERSVSGGSLGKRKQAPEADEHDAQSPEKKSPSRGLLDLTMSTPTSRSTGALRLDTSFGKGDTAVDGMTLEPSPPLFASSLSPDDPSRSPKSAGSTSTASASSDPSSDLTSGPVLLTPPDDGNLDPTLLDRSELPEHLRDVSTEDIRAIMEAGGVLKLTGSPGSKGSSSTLTAITLSDEEQAEPDDTARIEWSPHRQARGIRKFPPRLEPLFPPRSCPWIPPLPAQALGPKTIQIIRQLWWDVRAELRVCKCGVCKRRLEMEAYEEDDDEVDEDLKVVDPRWSTGDGAKKMRLG